MKYLKRAIRAELEEYLKYFPVLLISGARQVGKSTLALHLGIDNYITLDDINIYEMAKNDPRGFIENLQKPVIIDEAQRLPQLMISIKEQHIDKKRINGEFVLTGSASLQGFKDISDSLAGRIGIVELYPLSLKEKSQKEQNIIDIFSDSLDAFILKKYESDITQDILDGGYPEILKIDSQKAKYLWFSSYIRTYIESDARELANIRNIDKFIKIYRLCMIRSANMFNKNELQKEAGLDNRTFDSYFAVMEHTYQIRKLQPFFKNQLKRLIKTPKIYATDTGILNHLLQINSKEELETSHYKGDIIETFIYDELLKANSSALQKVGLYYYRTTDKKEIDFILDYGQKVIAIEIKASKSVSKDDFKHIYHLQKELPKLFDKGIVLYGGDTLLRLDERMYAVPFGFLI